MEAGSAIEIKNGMPHYTTVEVPDGDCMTVLEQDYQMRHTVRQANIVISLWGKSENSANNSISY